MRLRQKFLLLVALLLISVLGGSFAVIFSDLRAEFVNGLQQDLVTSKAVFRSQEKQRFQSLEVMASFLEGSPAFRNVLRRSDYQTVQTFLSDLTESVGIGLIVVTDGTGQLLNRTDQKQQGQEDLSSATPIQPALSGGVAHDYWVSRGKLYQVVSFPLVDSRDYIDGTLTLGLAVDRPYLDGLSREVGGQVAFRMKGNWALATDPVLLEEPRGQFLRADQPLGSSETDSSGTVIFGKSLEPTQRFVIRSQMKLLSLGSVAFLLALMISVPLIGKMTNPVEQLEQAQAEMETIFNTNLDGLMAADEQGIVTTCNPAAGVALGKPEQELLGSQLGDVLPKKVADGSGTFTRGGRTFQLYRTFVRREFSDLLGSILLIHDVTEQNERETRFEEFLRSLNTELNTHDLELAKLAVQNLAVWGALESEDVAPESKECRLGELVAKLHGITTSEDQDAKVWVDEKYLTLILENLRSVLGGTMKIGWTREGGSYRVTAASANLTDCPNSIWKDLDPTEPLRSDKGVDGLRLHVVCRLLALHHTRAKRAVEDKVVRFEFVLPAAVKC